TFGRQTISPDSDPMSRFKLLKVRGHDPAAPKGVKAGGDRALSRFDQASLGSICLEEPIERRVCNLVVSVLVNDERHSARADPDNAAAQSEHVFHVWMPLKNLEV